MTTANDTCSDPVQSPRSSIRACATRTSGSSVDRVPPGDRRITDRQNTAGASSARQAPGAPRTPEAPPVPRRTAAHAVRAVELSRAARHAAAIMGNGGNRHRPGSVAPGRPAGIPIRTSVGPHDICAIPEPADNLGRPPRQPPASRTIPGHPRRRSRASPLVGVPLSRRTRSNSSRG